MNILKQENDLLKGCLQSILGFAKRRHERAKQANKAFNYKDEKCMSREHEAGSNFSVIHNEVCLVERKIKELYENKP